MSPTAPASSHSPVAITTASGCGTQDGTIRTIAAVATMCMTPANP